MFDIIDIIIYLFILFFIYYLFIYLLYLFVVPPCFLLYSHVNLCTEHTLLIEYLYADNSDSSPKCPLKFLITFQNSLLVNHWLDTIIRVHHFINIIDIIIDHCLNRFSGCLGYTVIVTFTSLLISSNIQKFLIHCYQNISSHFKLFTGNIFLPSLSSYDYFNH